MYYTYSQTQLYLPISTVRIQLHVSVLHVDQLQVEIFNLQISYTRCVGHLCDYTVLAKVYQYWKHYSMLALSIIIKYI